MGDVCSSAKRARYGFERDLDRASPKDAAREDALHRRIGESKEEPDHEKDGDSNSVSITKGTEDGEDFGKGFGSETMAQLFSRWRLRKAVSITSF